MALDPIYEESFQALMNRLGEGGPILEEKTFNITPGFEVRNAAGEELVFTYWDVVHRADDTYWAPVKEGDRKTLFDVTDYTVKAKSTDEWMPLPAWFGLERM
jgi:hypothetical protein